MSAAYHGPDCDLAPDGATIKAFCNWWFERCNHGLIEIGWLDQYGRGLIHFEQFARDDLDALVATAVQANLVAGQACYVRAATVKEWEFDRKTTDQEFVQAPGIWSDTDTLEDLERARTVTTLIRPNGSVITGTVPHMRVQSWFKASEPLVSGEMVRSLNRRLHQLYGGDPSVVNPSRLMRLPGTIAWPWKAGRIPELTQFVLPSQEDNRLKSYPLGMFTSQLPGRDDQEQPRSQQASSTSGGAFGVGGGLSTVSGLLNAIKSGNQWHNNVVKLVAYWIGVGRSSAEIMGHCEGWTLPGYTHDQTRREVAKAIEGARQKWSAPDVDPVLGETEPKRPAILSLAELRALPPPVWLVHGLVPEKSLVVPYGPPKAGKTFVILSLGLHIAAGREWFGHPVQQGAVVYIAGEGTGGLSMRLRAMQQHYQIGDEAPFWVIPKAVNFRVPADVNALEATIRATVGNVPVRLVVIDTLARAMPGADENSAQEVGAVIAAADYIKEALHCTTALVHHEGKDGERGARGTSALRGAWDAAYRIVSEGDDISLTVIDQKDAESGQRLVFRMEEIQVGIGRSSLVPVLNEDAGEAPARRPRDISGHAGLVLQALRDIMASDESAALPPLSGIPDGGIRGASVETLRRKVYERMPSSSPDARQKAFIRSVQNLMQRQVIGVRDPWVWLV
jgi:AAA domain-containing protein